MAIKNAVYLFLPLQISLWIVFTLKVRRNFQFNGDKVPIHMFIIPHATEIHIPPMFGPDLIPWLVDANIVIFTCICVFSSKSYLTFRTTIRIVFPRRSAPLFCCFIEIHLIFQILVHPRQQLELLAYGSQLESYVSVLCR